MYPAKFDYTAPTSLEGVVALLAQYGDDAKVLAGGHSLLPLLKLRFVQPSHLVDLRRVPGLSGIHRDGDAIVIGAMTTHAAVAASAELRSTLPIVPDAAGQIGDPQVRHRGTIGGSLAHADPGADMPAVMLATAAQIIAVGSGGTRAIAADNFFVGILTSALAPGEVITEIRILIPRGRHGSAYSKQPHPASRFAVVGVAATVILDNSGATVRDARVAVTGLGPKATLAAVASGALVGTSADDAAIAAAAAKVADGIEARSDLQGDATYKMHLAEVHAGRAITEAVARARASG